jgi:hypothetical protein
MTSRKINFEIKRKLKVFIEISLKNLKFSEHLSIFYLTYLFCLQFFRPFDSDPHPLPPATSLVKIIRSFTLLNTCL